MAMSFSATGREQTAPSGRNTVYIAPNETRTMTVSRAGLVLISVEVPKGTTLGVSYANAGNVLPQGDGRFVFHGDVTVRAMARSQKDPTMTLEQAMLQSPLQLTGTGVHVVITRQSQ